MSDDKVTPPDLAGSLGEVLERLIKDGFRPPLYAVAVALNGSILVLRYVLVGEAEGLEAEVLAEHSEPAAGRGFFALPINIMITDAEGEAARVVLTNDGTQIIH